MKRTAISTKRLDPALRAAALAAAPDAPVADADNPPTTMDDWADAVVSRDLPELRAKLAQRRMRGPGKNPAKVAIQLRLPPDVLARWKATGPGWQTRMAQRLARAR